MAQAEARTKVAAPAMVNAMWMMTAIDVESTLRVRPRAELEHRIYGHSSNLSVLNSCLDWPCWVARNQRDGM